MSAMSLNPCLSCIGQTRELFEVTPWPLPDPATMACLEFMKSAEDVKARKHAGTRGARYGGMGSSPTGGHGVTREEAKMEIYFLSRACGILRKRVDLSFSTNALIALGKPAAM